MENVNILVVEDEALIRMTTVNIVEDAGYSVVEAANADEAIIILERCPEISAVLTDINMPGTMDGLQLAHVIRIRWPLIGLVISSGRFVAKVAQMPAGALFLSKPYTPVQITDALRSCVA